MPVDLRAQLQSSLGSAYRIESQLSGGAMSCVFVATEIEFGRRVIVKVFPPEVAALVSASRFRREIRIAGSLTHPHIVPLLSAGERDGLLYYTMPLIEGESLQSRLLRERQLPVVDAVRIAAQIADALDFAHRHDVVHRDIKPGNILLNDGHAFVTDFGISRAIAAASDERATEGSLSIGTAAYMSPEQAAGETHLDGRSDIYALGCVLYEMLVGAPPFTAPTSQAVFAQHWTQEPRSPRASRAGVGAELERVVMQALAKVPADRYQTASDLAAAIRATLDTTSAPRSPPPSRNAARIALGATATAALLVLSVVGARRWWPRPSDSSRSPTALMLPFTSSVAASDSLGATVQQLVSSALEWVPGIRTVAGPASARVPLSNQLEAARSRGARYLVTGTIAPLPASHIVTASVYAAPSGELVIQTADTAATAALLASTERIALRIIRALNQRERLDFGAHASLFNATTSAEALGHLVRGQRQLWREQLDEAQTSMRAAIASDSACALAYDRLSVVATWQHDYAAALAAVDAGLARRASMAPRWTALLRAQRHYVLREGDSAITAFQTAVLEHQDDIDAWWGLAESLYHFAGFTGQSSTDSRAAFDRVATMDSAFGPVYAHLFSLALWARDTAAARRYLQRFRDGDPKQVVSAQAFRLWLADPSTRASERRALAQADRGTLSDLVELAIRERFDLPFADTIGAILATAGRAPADRQRGGDYRLVVLGGLGRWPEAVAAWRAAAGDPSFDDWMLHAYFAGYPAKAIAAPMLSRARAMVRAGRAPDFALPSWESPNLAFAAVVHDAMRNGDVAEIGMLSAALRRAAPTADSSDPLRHSLSAALLGRHALLAHDTTRAIEQLEIAASRIGEPWPTYYPLLAMSPERALLAELLMARGDGRRATRWIQSLANSRSLADALYADRIRQLRSALPH